MLTAAGSYLVAVLAALFDFFFESGHDGLGAFLELGCCLGVFFVDLGLEVVGLEVDAGLGDEDPVLD